MSQIQGRIEKWKLSGGGTIVKFKLYLFIQLIRYFVALIRQNHIKIQAIGDKTCPLCPTTCTIRVVYEENNSQKLLASFPKRKGEQVNEYN